MKRKLLGLLFSHIFLLLASAAAWSQTFAPTVGVTVSVRNNARGYLVPADYLVNLGNAGGQAQYRVQISTTSAFDAPVVCPATGCNTLSTNTDRNNISLAGTGLNIVPGQTYYLRAQAITGPGLFNPNIWGPVFTTVAYQYSVIQRIESPLATDQSPVPSLIPSNTTVTTTRLTNADEYGLGYVQGLSPAYPPTLTSATNEFTLTNLAIGEVYTFAGAARFDPVTLFGPYSTFRSAVIYEPPVIVEPANAATVNTVFDVVVDGPITASPFTYAYQYQWSTDPDNFPADPNAQTSSSSPDVIIPAEELGFIPGQTYYLRARARMDANANGTPDTWGWYGPAVAVQVSLPGLAETYLNLPFINTPVSPYFDSYTYDLLAVPVTGATAYEWEIYTTPNVDGVTPAPVPLLTKTTPSYVWPGIITTDLISGGEFFVRIRAQSVNATTGEIVYSPWTSNANMAASRFFNSLHPGVATSPSGEIANTLQRTLKCLTVANNDLFGYFFQVATDPEFVNVVANAPGYGGTEYIPAIDNGRPVFRANGWDVGNNQPRFIYFRATAYNVTYYLRVRTFRTDAAGNFLQQGYWMSGPQYVQSFRFIVAREGFEGTYEPTDMTKLSFYPNPFTGTGLINIPGEYGQVKVQVVNALGVTVEERTANGGDILNLGRTWRSGVYIVRISDENQLNQTIRVVKQ